MDLSTYFYLFLYLSTYSHSFISSFGLRQMSILAAVLLLDIYPDTSKNQLYIPPTVISKNSNIMSA